MTQDLFNEQVWEQAWKEDPQAMGNKMKRAGVDFTRSFDHKAKAFNEEVFSESGRRRAERIAHWIEGQGVNFDGISVLDVGAASGGFSVPFAQRGASVTAIEPCMPLVELLEANTAEFNRNQVRVSIVPQAFEDIDVANRGWEQAFDLVFVSMCPTIIDWDSVERVLNCANRFCYISLPAGGTQHSLVNEVLPLLPGQKRGVDASDMAYLLHLLYLKGYAYESIVTREMKTTELSTEDAIKEVMAMLPNYHSVPGEASRKIISDYVHRTYGDGLVTISQGGRFGKVLIRLKEQNMYSRVKV